MRHLKPTRRVALLMVVSATSVLLALTLTACTGRAPENPSLTPSASDGRDYAQNMAACLGDEGWEVEVRSDGGINAQIPPNQESAYNEDRVRCEQKFDYDATPPPMTDAEVHDLYVKVLETAACLEKQGHDPGDPPSEQEFIDQMHGLGGWDPYIDVYVPGRMTEQEYFNLLALCPRQW